MPALGLASYCYLKNLLRCLMAWSNLFRWQTIVLYRIHMGIINIQGTISSLLQDDEGIVQIAAHYLPDAMGCIPYAYHDGCHNQEEGYLLEIKQDAEIIIYCCLGCWQFFAAAVRLCTLAILGEYASSGCESRDSKVAGVGSYILAL